jgi:uncharacterized protein YdhG (YjbR/CyaY superfamily)
MTKTVDEYMAGIPEPARSTLAKVREVILSVVPEETTEGISYQIPAYKYKGMLVGFAAFTNHCSLMVMNPTVMDLFPAELKKYKTSKGTIQFAIDKPPPASFLTKLVKARIQQNEAKKTKA